MRAACTLSLLLAAAPCAALHVFDSDALTPSESFLLNIYNGLATQQHGVPSVWINWAGWAMNDIWVDELRAHNHVAFDRNFTTLRAFLDANPAEVRIDGYIYAALETDSQWYAASLAAGRRALVASDAGTAALMHALAVPRVLDLVARPVDLRAAWSMFKADPSANYDMVMVQQLNLNIQLVDYAVANQAFIFWSDDFTQPAPQLVLSELNANARVFGWSPDEGNFVGIMSQHDLSVVCSNLVLNLVVLATSWAGQRPEEASPRWWAVEGRAAAPAPPQRVPRGPTRDLHTGLARGASPEVVAQYVKEVREGMPHVEAEEPPLERPAAAAAAEPAAKNGTHYVAFVVSDGDNVQYLMTGFFTLWYGSPLRGKVPLTWTISGSADTVVPVVYDAIMRNATPNDDFVIGPSGYGYTYLNDWPTVHRNARGRQPPANPVHAFAASTAAFSKRTGVRAVNFLDMSDEQGGYPQAVDVYTADPFVRNYTDAVVYYQYSNYAGLNGAMYWSNGVLVIGGKQVLWDGFNTPEGLAEKINGYTTDPASPDCYSVIPVHAWSENMTSVLDTAAHLAPHVKTVTLTELLRLARQNVVPY